MQTIDGILNEPTVNFVGKDGFFWWVGEVEENNDPMKLGRVKVRVLGYYTNVRGATTADLPTEYLPWATVLQGTDQAGNDGQGESSGQLQPGAIVMGFFMDGESAQMPIVIGVLRVKKSGDSRDKKIFAFTGENMEPGVAPNVAALNPASPNSTMAATKEAGYKRQSDANTVALPGDATSTAGGPGSPKSIGTTPGINGSAANPSKPRQPKKPIPSANGVGGPWKTLEYKLSYLLEDLADTAGGLVKAEDGDFLDIATGKLVRAKALTAKIQNFLGAVFAQVVSAVRQSLANLAEQLELVNILGGVTGAPFVIFTAIQSAVTTILSSLCNIDSQLIGYIQDPIGSIFNILEGFLDGLISKAQFVLQSVQEVIDSVICQVQKILDQVLGIVDTVSSIVSGVQQAQEIIEAWKAGSGVFEAGTDLIQKGIKSISGLIALFIKFASSNCGRSPDGGVDTVGWYPLFGVTHCSEAELAEINKIRGDSRGSCGGGDGGNFLDSFFKEADPYLTAAKTFLDGSYQMYVGTPGRRASVHRSASGTTTTSIRGNNSEYAEHKYREELRKQNANLTPEEEEKQVEAYKKKSNSNKNDTGNLVADHTSYAGNHTREVHGDDCKLVDGDGDITIEGDYRLKVTGDFHLEVGGGFFVCAEGSPKVVNKQGEEQSTKIQKHTIRFGSDVDVNVVGAKFELQGAECNLASTSTKITGSLFENSSAQQTYSGAELILSGDNSIEINTTSLYENINLGPIPAAKAGILRTVKGSVETIMAPGGSASDAIPRYTIANPSGTYTCAVGLTHSQTSTGAMTAACGVYNLSSAAAATIKAVGAITINATGACVITGATIKLN